MKKCQSPARLVYCIQISFMAARSERKPSIKTLDDVTESLPPQESRTAATARAEAEARAEAIGARRARDLAEITAIQAESGRVELRNEHGEQETWRILENRDGILLLSRKSVHKEMFVAEAAYAEYLVYSPSEAALESKAAEYHPFLENYWKNVVAAAEVRPEAASFDFAKHKEAIIASAAMRATGEEAPDLALLLNDALRDALDDHAHAHTVDVLNRTVNVNDSLMHLRIGAMPERKRLTFDEELTLLREPQPQAPTTDATAPLLKKHTVAFEEEVTVPIIKAEAAALTSRVPEAALAPARGEATLFTAINTLKGVDALKPAIRSLEGHLAQLQDLRKKAEKLYRDKTARAAVILGIQRLVWAALVAKMMPSPKKAEQVAPAPKATEMVVELDGEEEKPAANNEVRVGDAAWAAADREAWKLEKQALTAAGETAKLAPEKFSAIYAIFKEAVARGEMTKKYALKQLEQLAGAPTTSAKEKEGILLLSEEFYNEDSDTAASLSAVSVKTPSAPLRKNFTVTKKLATPVPVEKIIEDNTEDTWFHSALKLQTPEGTIIGNAPFRKVAEAFGGPEEFRTLFNRLEEAHLAPFTWDALYNRQKLSRVDIAKVIQEVRHAVNRLPEMPEGGWMEKEERQPTPHEQIAEAFGGTEMFGKMYRELEADNTAPYPFKQIRDAKKITPANLRTAIRNISARANALEKKAKKDSLLRDLTPYEQLVDAYGGEEALRYAYEEARARGKVPFNLDKLREKRTLPPERVQEYIDRMRQTAAASVDKGEFGQTPFEQIVDGLGGGRIFEAAYKRLDAKGDLPYTMEEIRNIQPDTFWRRFIPGRLTAAKVIDAFNKALVQEAREEQDASRRSNTFSGRKGGRQRLSG